MGPSGASNLELDGGISPDWLKHQIGVYFKHDNVDQSDFTKRVFEMLATKCGDEELQNQV